MRLRRHSLALGAAVALVATLATGGAARADGPKVTIVNLIPKSLSGETNQDSEPYLGVNAANPLELAASAFTPNPLGGPRAPIFVSTDGGNTWSLRPILPSQTQTVDITLGISGLGRLYAGILRLPEPAPNDTRLNILRTDSVSAPGLMKVLVDRNHVDQPYVHVRTVGGQDRLTVGDNDFAGVDGKTGAVDAAFIPGAAPTTSRVDSRGGNPDEGAMDGPQIRPAMHPKGSIYVAFYGWRTFLSSSDIRGVATADVVVVRDDGGALQFTALKEPSAAPGDGKAGIRVAKVITLPWINDMQADFGQERIGGDLSIAVDPRDNTNPGGKHTVYLAYADQPASGVYSLHLVRSDDGGETWSNDLRGPLVRAKNPALAVNEDGTVAFLYQQVSAPGSDQQWSTVLELSKDKFQNHSSLVLARAPADTPVAQFIPYLGDYLNLTALGKTFHGIFSMSNVPDPGNFPTVKPTYQRNADFTSKQLLATDNATPVSPSIDPFYFKVEQP